MTDTPCPTVDPDGVPNLDAMEDSELLQFWLTHQDGMEWRRLFTEGLVDPEVTQEVARLLGLYAWHLYLARFDRRDGQIRRAEEYEAHAQRFYNQLPDWARW